MDSKIQAKDMTFLRAILNNTITALTRNTNITLGLGVVKIKNEVQKSRLKGFGHVTKMTEKRVLKKMLYKKWRGNVQEEDLEPDEQTE